MSPTRELANRLTNSWRDSPIFANMFCCRIWRKRCLRIGTTEKGDGCRFCDCNSGRLISYQFGKCRFSHVSILFGRGRQNVDMGFYDDIIQIVNKLPKTRQLIMFSATMPAKSKVGRDYLE